MEHQNEVVEGKWHVRHDESSGNVYYVNIETGEATWDLPRPPSAWTDAVDDNGRVYYINMTTMETRWDPPPLETIRPISPQQTDKRPSTAEQLESLNRLLMGGDDDEEEQQDDVLMDADALVLPSIDEAATSAPVERPATCSSSSMPWMMFYHEEDGAPYYYNHLTGECRWDPPPEFLQYHEDHHTDPTHPTHHEAQMIPLDQLTSTEEFRLLLTPEFQDKVRKAIEQTSKTPIGTGRLLIVRTPSEKLLTTRSGRKTTASSSEHDPKTVYEASALVIQCLVRCFVARRRVQKKRLERATVVPKPSEEEHPTGKTPDEEQDQQDQHESEKPEALERAAPDATIAPEKPEEPEETAPKEPEESAKELENVTPQEPEKSDEEAKPVREMAPEEPEGTDPQETALKEEDDGAHQLREIGPDIPQETEAEAPEPHEPETPQQNEEPDQLEPPATVETMTEEPMTDPVPSTLTITEPVEEAPVVETPIAPAPAAPVAPAPEPRIETPPSPSIKKASVSMKPKSMTSSSCPPALCIPAFLPPKGASKKPTTDKPPQPQNGIQRKSVTALLEAKRQQLQQWQLNRRKVPTKPAESTSVPLDEEITKYQQLYQTAAKQYADQTSQLIAKRTKPTLDQVEIKESEDTQRHIAQELNHQTLWGLLQTQSRNLSPAENAMVLDNIHARLDRMADDPSVIIEDLVQERYRQVLERSERLHAEAHHTQQSIERLETVLKSDDSDGKTRYLTAKHASLLRHQHQTTVAKAQYWQSQAQAFENQSSTAYWTSVRAHWTKFSDLELHQEALFAFRYANGDSLLHHAVWKGLSDHVRLLLTLGMDVNMVDNSICQWTPLHEACRSGQDEMVALLLDSGARIDTVDCAGDTPLHVACRYGFSSIVQRLLDHLSSHHVAEIFYLRNGKQKFAMDLVKLSSLRTLLEHFAMDLPPPPSLCKHSFSVHPATKPKPKKKMKQQSAKPKLVSKTKALRAG